MCVLSDTSLQYHLDVEDILVSPMNADSLQPNSIDVRLGDTIKMSVAPFSWVKPYHYDWREKPPLELYQEFDLRKQHLILPPKRFALGVTLEYVRIPSFLTCTIEGRSSVGRMGLRVVNAGRVDTAYEGKLTLELLNEEEFGILLTRGMPIAQLVFSTLSGEVDKPYGHDKRHSKYQGDTDPTPSKIYLEK